MGEKLLADQAQKLKQAEAKVKNLEEDIKHGKGSERRILNWRKYRLYGTRRYHFMEQRLNM
eukprot:TRINITY_DN8119_c0_g1_i1.p2 TRINITY_DN8119_c0_g1~~TRINITY_DN8119_c0_g1_i1.p2  ORF type:complete len:61 (-),score=9.52 TRINITY_DN8119_c0_g1_i1:29-211(-)